MVSIFMYTNFREYLNDQYAHAKAANKNISYRYIAQRVGFKSPGQFTQILHGKTNISNKLMLNFGRYLKLKKRELEYFDLIVCFTQAGTVDEKKYYLEKMVNFKEVKTMLLSPEHFEFYQKWYYSVIRDLLSIYPFDGDYKKLASMIEPTISSQEAEKAIRLLCDLNLIRIAEDGVYRVTDSFIASSQEKYSVLLSGYAQQMLDRAREAIDRIPKEERLISWAGFSVSLETYNLIIDEVRATTQRILSLVEQDKEPDRVYHFNVQLFPVSKRLKNTQQRIVP